MKQVIVILLLATALRFMNLSWDGGHNFHPDEALIVNGALSIRFFDQLYPGFHDYNGLPVYLLRLITPLTSSVVDMTYLGRMLTAALSTITVFAVFLLGKRLWGKSVGLLAAALLAPLPLAVQLAHFYTSDTFVVFFLTLLSLAVVNWWQYPSRRNIFFCALWAGLAIACKNTAYLLLLMPAIAIFLRKASLKERFEDFVILGAGVVGIFAITSPYSLIDFRGYLERAQYLGLVVAGRLQFDWTVQFMGTTPLFWVRNSLYAFGPAVAIVGALGVLRGAWVERGSKRLIALWSVVFVVLLLGVYLKFIRYLLPLSPMFALFTAALVVEIHKRAPQLGKVVGAIVVGITWIWGIMFAGIYLTPHPIVRAASWIAQNVPAGTRVVREEGNELLRFANPPLSSRTYRLSLIHPYALPDTKEKAVSMLTQISQAQYVLVESDKVERTVMRLRDEYPYTRRVYEAVVDGSLGYRITAEFSSFPHVGPFVLKDLNAEETFWVFDHPRVRIFRNEEGLSSQDLERRLGTE